MLNSTALSRPGLQRMSSGTAALPTSWMDAAKRTRAACGRGRPISSAMSSAMRAVRRSCPAVYGSRSPLTALSALVVARVRR
jgi:hypothetical protein